MAAVSKADARRAGRARLSVVQFYWLLIVPAVALMAGLYFFPLVKVLLISVSEPEPGFGNYEKLISSESIHQTLIVTLRICVITTFFTLLLGYVVSYAMVQASMSWLRWLMFFVLLPLWISVLVRAFSWITLLRSNGLVNEALLAWGVIDSPLSLMRNEFGVSVGMIHYMLPFAVLPLYANMRTIDLRLIAAARALGAPPWTAFRRIFLPLSMPGVVASSMLVFIFSMGFYVTPALLGGGRVFMVAEYIGIQITQTLRWGVGTMLAAVLLVSILLLLLLLGRVVNLRKLFGAE